MEWRKKSQWNIAVFNNEKKLEEIFHYSDDDQYDYVRMEKLNDLFSYYNAIERQMSVKKTFEVEKSFGNLIFPRKVTVVGH